MRKVIIITRGLDKPDNELIEVIKAQIIPKTEKKQSVDFKIRSILNYQII